MCVFDYSYYIDIVFGISLKNFSSTTHKIWLTDMDVSMLAKSACKSRLSSHVNQNYQGITNKTLETINQIPKVKTLCHWHHNNFLPTTATLVHCPDKGVRKRTCLPARTGLKLARFWANRRVRGFVELLSSRLIGQELFTIGTIKVLRCACET